MDNSFPNLQKNGLLSESEFPFYVGDSKAECLALTDADVFNVGGVEFFNADRNLVSGISFGDGVNFFTQIYDTFGGTITTPSPLNLVECAPDVEFGGAQIILGDYRADCHAEGKLFTYSALADAFPFNPLLILKIDPAANLTNLRGDLTITGKFTGDGSGLTGITSAPAADISDADGVVSIVNGATFSADAGAIATNGAGKLTAVSFAGGGALVTGVDAAKLNGLDWPDVDISNFPNDAGYLDYSGTISQADSASYADTCGAADYADNAGYADSCSSADNAGYADSCGDASCDQNSRDLTTLYGSDNFIAGADYLAPSGDCSLLTGILSDHVFSDNFSFSLTTSNLVAVSTIAGDYWNFNGVFTPAAFESGTVGYIGAASADGYSGCGGYLFLRASDGKWCFWDTALDGVSATNGATSPTAGTWAGIGAIAGFYVGGSGSVSPQVVRRPNSNAIKTIEGDIFYAHTVAGNLVWTASP